MAMDKKKLERAQKLALARKETRKSTKAGFGSKRNSKDRKRTEENKREQHPNDRAVADAQGRYLVPRRPYFVSRPPERSLWRPDSLWALTDYRRGSLH